MCCGWFCKEYKGWYKSFTTTEKVLTILEAVLLAVLIVLLIFLILHLLACSEPKKYDVPKELVEMEEPVESEHEETEIPDLKFTIVKRPTTTKIKTTRTTTTTRQTIDPALDCTWTPSAKTTAFTHYYENNAFQTEQSSALTKMTTTTEKPKQHKIDTDAVHHDVDFEEADQTDGEDAEPPENKYVLSLVKLKPPQGVVFGCILTIIDLYWVLTSASCIEAIEEVDSLDSFVIMEDYGTGSGGKIHAINDLQIHPFYQGTNRSYDLAMIKSESGLVNGQAVELPTLLDHSMITIGERFHILGFGAYRSIDESARGRSLRKVHVYRLPAQQCGGGGSAWALRHLAPGSAAPAPHGAEPRGGGVCAGVLYARGLPCNYCSGAPLLRGALLLALMADNQQCGVACEPQLYVGVAARGDWIRSVVNAE